MAEELEEKEENQFRAARLQKLAALKALGVDPYPYEWQRSAEAKELEARYAELPPDAVTEDRVSIAGRVRAIRNSGMFIDLFDTSGKIQVFSDRKSLDEKTAALLPLLDLGDIIGVEGIVRRTRRGELTVNAKRIEVLAKALLPLPEKYHGLADLETRYRQRYLDLIMNEESRAVLQRRSRIIATMRRLLIERGFLEVETPMLHVIPGGAAAKPFVTHHNALDMQLYLRIAPELHLKRLLVGGLSDKLFEINRNFRNEGISPRHNPEFTSLELYQAFVDYREMMVLTETLIAEIAQEVLGATRIRYGSHEIELAGSWPRESMAGLVKRETGVDFLAIAADEDARAAARRLGAEIADGAAWGRALEAVFAAKVEDKLVQPIHVTGFPREISPLAKTDRNDPRLTERFET